MEVCDSTRAVLERLDLSGLLDWIQRSAGVEVLPDVVEKLKQNEIDGSCFADLSVDELGELGFKLGHRAKIRAALIKAPDDTPRKSAEGGISVSAALPDDQKQGAPAAPADAAPDLFETEEKKEETLEQTNGPQQDQTDSNFGTVRNTTVQVKITRSKIDNSPVLDFRSVCTSVSNVFLHSSYFGTCSDPSMKHHDQLCWIDDKPVACPLLSATNQGDADQKHSVDEAFYPLVQKAVPEFSVKFGSKKPLVEIVGLCFHPSTCTPPPPTTSTSDEYWIGNQHEIELFLENVNRLIRELCALCHADLHAHTMHYSDCVGAQSWKPGDAPVFRFVLKVNGEVSPCRAKDLLNRQDPNLCKVIAHAVEGWNLYRSECPLCFITNFNSVSTLVAHLNNSASTKENRFIVFSQRVQKYYYVYKMNLLWCAGREYIGSDKWAKRVEV
mmetsp:Transcript_16052/g.31440  ORF Transcript_16052/g.31440 Transcript_16052/m.31440 type:complete len:441 (-) Transcript_16052:216-1538(-)|eukprot:CAMPEP_0175169576 /NCGR_PEP_ID=MMETSP0087-20121206/29682_1 /TAXON_ID=136419 /ORGANISM="Unknown Unknown, Strain D1" /LENGTH=440 /DNA_ID=CAMNT_0016460007 /DNA_START=36 /DNA_END=1358 /DNA_ORIENTATION=+